MNHAGRFTGRAEEYARGRPSYPEPAVDFVIGDRSPRDLCVADVGAGTGMFAVLLQQRGATVTALEPNVEMADACQEALVDPAAVVRVAAAEATGLPDASQDLLTVAQAFHWFDADAVAREFRRILRSGAPLAVLWNHRRLEGSDFALAYEEFLQRHGTDYREVVSTYENSAALETVFGVVPERRVFDNRQHLDREGLRARVRSCSYIPGPESAPYDALLAAIEELFDRHARDGAVTLEYDTVVYRGPLL